MTMEKALVTIIVPAYNTEQYIGIMLDSIIRQSYSYLQIIVIDDGSTDSTASIIKKYTKIDSRITMFSSSHGGVSKARNLGLDYAKGEKVLFFDSDDFVEKDTVEQLLECCKKNNCNAAMCNYYDYYDEKDHIPYESELKGIYKSNKIVSELMPHYIGYSYGDINNWIIGTRQLKQGKENNALWRVLFDLNTIKQAGIRFDEMLSLGEDTIFLNEYFLNETSICFTKEYLYHLRRRETGANMKSITNPILMAQNKIKLIDGRMRLDKVARCKGMEIHDKWEGTMVFSALELAIRLAKNTGDKKKNKNIYKGYVRNENVSESIHRFRPIMRIKGLPFVLLRINPFLLYRFIRIMPENLIRYISQ